MPKSFPEFGTTQTLLIEGRAGLTTKEDSELGVVNFLRYVPLIKCFSADFTPKTPSEYLEIPLT